MKTARKLFVGLLALSCAIVVEDFLPLPGGGILAPDADARVGRPLTPMSYAGVARRTTRRVVRRSTIYVATLPTTCVQQNYDGAVVYYCGGNYYQPYGNQYVVVYLD